MSVEVFKTLRHYSLCYNVPRVDDVGRRCLHWLPGETKGVVKVKNAMTVVTAIPASIGLVLVEHPVLAGIVIGWLTFKTLKRMRRY